MDEPSGVLGVLARAWYWLADSAWGLGTGLYLGMLLSRLGWGTAWLLGGFGSPKVCCLFARKLWSEHRRGRLDPVRVHRAVLGFIQERLSEVWGDDAAAWARVWIDHECAVRDQEGIALWLGPPVRDVAFAAREACERDNEAEGQSG